MYDNGFRRKYRTDIDDMSEIYIDINENLMENVATFANSRSPGLNDRQPSEHKRPFAARLTAEGSRALAQALQTLPVEDLAEPLSQVAESGRRPSGAAS